MWILYLICVFSISQLIIPAFIKEDENFLCYMKFDEPLRIKNYEILEGRRNRPVEEYDRVFLKKYDSSILINSMEIDLTQKCSFSRKSSFLVCFNLEGNRKIYSVPFMYDLIADNFVVESTKKPSVSHDEIN